MSSTDSCGRPLRNDVDSMPSPVTAPPSVIVFSCGTTSGANARGSVAATRSSYVHIPATSAVRASGSTVMTSVNPDVFRPLTVFLARVRNRFDVGLASRTVAFSGMDR
jgi:hypothetical protein